MRIKLNTFIRALVLFMLLILAVSVCGINKTEHDLHRHLFQFCNPDVLSVINSSKVIGVSMSFFSIQHCRQVKIEILKSMPILRQ